MCLRRDNNGRGGAVYKYRVRVDTHTSSRQCAGSGVCHRHTGHNRSQVCQAWCVSPTHLFSSVPGMVCVTDTLVLQCASRGVCHRRTCSPVCQALCVSRIESFSSVPGMVCVTDTRHNELHSILYRGQKIPVLHN